MRSLCCSRRTPRLARVLLCLIVFTVCPLCAQAQTFDAARYTELVNTSNELYREAQGETDEAARAELLSGSASLKREALDMLRTALLDGEVDSFREQAEQDLFNLQQNLIVLLSDLDRCAEALGQLEEALGDTEILPEGSTEQLATMRTNIVDCEARVAAAVVETNDPDGTETLPPDETGHTDGPETPPTDGGDPPPAVDDGEGVNVVAISLIAGGAAIALGGLVWDLALGGTRDDYDALRAECETSCDQATYERVQELQSDLDTGAVGTLVLYGVGGATVVVGTVLLILSLGDDEPPVAVAPSFGPTHAGVVMGFEF